MTAKLPLPVMLARGGGLADLVGRGRGGDNHSAGREGQGGGDDGEDIAQAVGRGTAVNVHGIHSFGRTATARTPSPGPGPGADRGRSTCVRRGCRRDDGPSLRAATGIDASAISPVPTLAFNVDQGQTPVIGDQLTGVRP